MVVHCVSEVRVHAAVLGAVVDGRGRASAEAIVLAAGRALQELHRMHQIIDPAHTVSYTPQPDLDTLQELLDAERPLRPAHVRATRPVPAGVAACCYRVGLEVVRAIHGQVDARLAGARVEVAGDRLELWLDVDGADALDLRRAVACATLMGGTAAATPAGVRADFALEEPV